jgi:SAM-dependent methyltransferase
MREYDRIADWYLGARSCEVGRAEVDALARALPRVLDLGCGGGLPVSDVLTRAGMEVAGLDSSAQMLARYRRAFPGAEVRHARIQRAKFAPHSFAAVVAWGVLFHLDEAEQQAAIARVGERLRPMGQFLFTSAEGSGVREGEMSGVRFRYVSLGALGYRRALEVAGMRLVRHADDPWSNHVYLACKR